MKKILLVAGLMFCMTLAGCGMSAAPEETSTTGLEPVELAPEETLEPDGGAPAETPEPGGAAPMETAEPGEAASTDAPESSEAAPVDTPPAGDASPESPTEPDTPAEGQTATLYIGARASGFGEYPYAYEGALTPELLIQGIADLTGWNLTLAETVTTGRGGMSVCLSGESSLFTGPPDPQKEEFHMYDAGQLAETILDSIQKTLQMGFTGELGNPDALDIYYYMEGELPLELPNLGLSWPLEEPYHWKTPAAE